MSCEENNEDCLEFESEFQFSYAPVLFLFVCLIVFLFFFLLFFVWFDFFLI